MLHYCFPSNVVIISVMVGNLVVVDGRTITGPFIPQIFFECLHVLDAVSLGDKKVLQWGDVFGLVAEMPVYHSRMSGSKARFWFLTQTVCWCGFWRQWWWLHSQVPATHVGDLYLISGFYSSLAQDLTVSMQRVKKWMGTLSLCLSNYFKK